MFPSWLESTDCEAGLMLQHHEGYQVAIRPKVVIELHQTLQAGHVGAGLKSS